jgi:hypothetical protein
MHLGDEMRRDKPVEWMTKDAWKANGKAGKVVLLDEPIEAGALIGHVGKVGPDDLSRAQIHVEFFSEQYIEIDGWTLVDGTAGGRFCEAQEINALIDQNKDGMLSRQELQQFFANGSGDQLHHMVTLHVSEWTFEPRWNEVLVVPKDFNRPRSIRWSRSRSRPACGGTPRWRRTAGCPRTAWSTTTTRSRSSRGSRTS